MKRIGERDKTRDLPNFISLFCNKLNKLMNTGTFKFVYKTNRRKIFLIAFLV